MAIEKQSTTHFDKIKNNSETAAAALKVEIGNVAKSTKGSIKTSFDDVDKIRKDTRESYGNFKRTYIAAMDGSKGIAARHRNVKIRHENVVTLHTDIKDLTEQSKERAVEIKIAKDASVADAKVVSDIKTRAEDVKQEIENTFHLTVDTALGGSLGARKAEIRGMMIVWASILGLSVTALVIVIGVLLYEGRANLTEALATRLVYVTPLLLIIFLVYRQFSHERHLLEEYAFKSAMAQTLRSYTLLLSENYKGAEAEKKTLDFLLGAMKNIYDRSALDHNTGFFYQMIIGNKRAGAEFRVQDGTAEIKQTASQKVRVSKTPKNE